MKYVKPQPTYLKKDVSSSVDTFKKVKDQMKHNQTAISKLNKKKKRSDESEGFGVDLNDVEPFERSVREQEGRRYLLWRKVTG